jgi:sugar/nucleoside kinase (ribokinase family)
MAGLQAALDSGTGLAHPIVVPDAPCPWNACKDVTFRVEILPRPRGRFSIRASHGGLGGKALNQAIAAARAEMDARLIAALGSDSPATLIRDTLRAERIATDTLIDLPTAVGRYPVTA